MHSTPPRLNRRARHFFGLLTFITLVHISPLFALVHPGGPLVQADLSRIRARVASGTEPWASAWADMESKGAGKTWTTNRSGAITNVYEMQNDGHAIWTLTLKWVCSGDIGYADTAKNGIMVWVNNVTSMTAVDPLRAGIGASSMARAAEILATGFGGAAGWSSTDVAKARTWFKNVVYPEVSTGESRSGNWGHAALNGCISIGVFCNDQAIFDYARSAYKNGFPNATDGCCGLTQYVWKPNGQITEMGRDQGHPQFALMQLIETALIAWNQGDQSLAKYSSNRIAAGLEFLAQYNLGNSVTWDSAVPDFCNKIPGGWKPSVNSTGRGEFHPIWEGANRICDLVGAAHPYASEVVNGAAYRPEGSNNDALGFGTLLFSRETGVTFYANTTYGGSAGASLPVGTYTLSQLAANGVPNDWASSVTVPPGRTVIVYQHDNFGGTSWTLTADTPNLGLRGANDQISSCRVQ